MKIFYFALFFLTSLIYNDIIKDDIAKDKPIWTDAVIVLNHQFKLVEGLGKIKSYLCLFRASDYIDSNNNALFINLEHEGNPLGHKVIVDALSCERAQYHTPWVYRAQQSSSDDPLVIDMFNLNIIIIVFNYRSNNHSSDSSHSIYTNFYLHSFSLIFLIILSILNSK